MIAGGVDDVTLMSRYRLSDYADHEKPMLTGTTTGYEIDWDLVGDIAGGILCIGTLGIACAAGCGGEPAKPVPQPQPPAPTPPPPPPPKYIVPQGQSCSARNFDDLALKLKEGIAANGGYSDLHFGTCVNGMTPEAFEFWCYGIENGQLFTVENGDAALGVCSSWKIDETLQAQPMCGSDLRHVANGVSDDDTAQVAYVLQMMERFAPPGQISGIATWSSEIVSGTVKFNQPVKLMYEYLKAHPEFQSFRAAFITGMYGLLNTCYAGGMSGRRSIFDMMKMIQTVPSSFATPWKTLDEASVNNFTWGDDWVTPTIHAGAVLQMMMDFAAAKADEVKAKVQSGEWKIKREDGKIYLIMGKKNNSPKVDLAEYLNAQIWTDSSFQKSTILTEAIAAVTKAKTRCFDCLPADACVAGLDPADMAGWDFPTLVIWQLTQMRDGGFGSRMAEELASTQRIPGGGSTQPACPPGQHRGNGMGCHPTGTQHGGGTPPPPPPPPDTGGWGVRNPGLVPGGGTGK